MGFMDVLNQYVGQQFGQPVAAAPQHFDQVAQQAPPSVISQGLAGAFRADETPPFGEMVARLFGNSDPQQRAGLLNQLLASLGPGLASGGPVADLLRRFGTAPNLTPEQAATVTPEQVQEIAHRAEKQNPSIIDRVSDFYAQHPTLVRTLGAAALTIALAKMAQRS